MGVIDYIKGQLKTGDAAEMYSELFLATVFLVRSVVENRLESNGIKLSEQDRVDIERYIHARFAEASKGVQGELYRKYKGEVN
jgi:hypothetical protein